MARGSEQARGAATSAQNISGTSAGNSGALYSTLAPQLAADAAAPSGMTPTDIAAVNTAEQQSAGGTQSAATGEAGLTAKRTRNAGSTGATIAKAARSGGELASEGALSTQIKNAGLKQSQRDRALTGMQNLYGINTGASVNALGEVANNVNADVNAKNASWNWAKYILDPMMQAAAGGAFGTL